jgi:hypothetical protein
MNASTPARLSPLRRAQRAARSASTPAAHGSICASAAPAAMSGAATSRPASMRDAAPDHRGGIVTLTPREQRAAPRWRCRFSMGRGRRTSPCARFCQKPRQRGGNEQHAATHRPPNGKNRPVACGRAEFSFNFRFDGANADRTIDPAAIEPIACAASHSTFSRPTVPVRSTRTATAPLSQASQPSRTQQSLIGLNSYEP